MIYNNPQYYAMVASCSLEIAYKRCEFFRDLLKEIERATICPNCGEPALIVKYSKTGGSDCFDNERIECKNCFYETAMGEQFKPLQWFEYTVDLVLYYSKSKDLLDMSWDEFVEKDTATLTKELVGLQLLQ